MKGRNNLKKNFKKKRRKETKPQDQNACLISNLFLLLHLLLAKECIKKCCFVRSGGYAEWLEIFLKRNNMAAPLWENVYRVRTEKWRENCLNRRHHWTFYSIFRKCMFLYMCSNCVEEGDKILLDSTLIWWYYFSMGDIRYLFMYSDFTKRIPTMWHLKAC